MKKYNLALTPISKSKVIIALAKKISVIADQYILGKHSHPHVTLYQFQAEEEKIEMLWKKVCSIWQQKTILLTFHNISYTTSDHEIFWTALLPDHEDELYKMHEVIATILQLPIKKTFSPHMTLVNSKSKEYTNAVDSLLTDSYTPITDQFVLSLGISDQIGQLTKIIYSLPTTS